MDHDKRWAFLNKQFTSNKYFSKRLNQIKIAWLATGTGAWKKYVSFVTGTGRKHISRSHRNPPRFPLDNIPTYIGISITFVQCAFGWLLKDDGGKSIDGHYFTGCDKDASYLFPIKRDDSVQVSRDRKREEKYDSV